MNETLKKIIRGQEGACLIKLIILALVVAVIALFVLDGISVLNAYNKAGNVSTGAARAAESEWKLNQSDSQARDAAAGYCQQNGLAFEDFQVLDKPLHGYQVSCPADAQTRIFQRLPWFKNLIHQDNQGSAFDS